MESPISEAGLRWYEAADVLPSAVSLYLPFAFKLGEDAVFVGVPSRAVEVSQSWTRPPKNHAAWTTGSHVRFVRVCKRRSGVQEAFYLLFYKMKRPWLEPLRNTLGWSAPYYVHFLRLEPRDCMAFAQYLVFVAANTADSQ